MKGLRTKAKAIVLAAALAASNQASSACTGPELVPVPEYTQTITMETLKALNSRVKAYQSAADA